MEGSVRDTGATMSAKSRHRSKGKKSALLWAGGAETLRHFAGTAKCVGSVQKKSVSSQQIPEFRLANVRPADCLEAPRYAPFFSPAPS